MGLISNSLRVERSANFLIMKKRKYGAMPPAKTVWRLLMPCMREHRKTITTDNGGGFAEQLYAGWHWLVVSRTRAVHDRKELSSITLAG